MSIPKLSHSLVKHFIISEMDSWVLLYSIETYFQINGRLLIFIFMNYKELTYGEQWEDQSFVSLPYSAHLQNTYVPTFCSHSVCVGHTGRGSVSKNMSLSTLHSWMMVLSLPLLSLLH